MGIPVRKLTGIQSDLLAIQGVQRNSPHDSSDTLYSVTRKLCKAQATTHNTKIREIFVVKNSSHLEYF